MHRHFCGRVSLSILALALVSLGCADDEPFVGPESDTLTGTWNFGVTIVLETGDCAGNNEPPWNAELEVTQTGNAVTVTGDWHSDPGTGPHTLGGTFDPDTRELVLDGNYPEGGGTLLALYVLNVDADFNRMTGTETWTWTSATELCHDSRSNVVANRVNPPAPD